MNSAKPDDAYQLLGAYALDAVTDQERAVVEALLRRDDQARAELQSFQRTAARLSTDEVSPPAHVRSDLLAQIHQVRPMPPSTMDEPSHSTTRRAPRRVGRRSVLIGAAATVAAAVVGVDLTRRRGSESMPQAVSEVMHAADARSSVIDMGEHKITVVRSMDMGKGGRDLDHDGHCTERQGIPDVGAHVVRCDAVRRAAARTS